MAIISSVILALTLGVTIGINFKRFIRKNSSATAQVAVENEPTNESKILMPYFDTLEIRFLKRILTSESRLLSVVEANEILRIERLSKENQRQRRHLFLKDLNMKLKMIYKVPECIERQSTELDRRSKYYCLHKDISKESIEDLLIEDN
ncbi:MAG: hypothetical protein KA527_04680 [Cytophagaceae bacterium]|nr:hypothetical protein [Cytophagaceae bacterium]